MIRLPPGSKPTDTRFPYPTLFRSKLHQGGDRHARATPQIVDRGEGRARAGPDNGGSVGVGQPLDHAQAEPDGEATVVGGRLQGAIPAGGVDADRTDFDAMVRSEEHTSELQSLMRISYAVFCLKKKKKQNHIHKYNTLSH